MSSSKRRLSELPASRNNRSFRDVHSPDPVPRSTTPTTAATKIPSPSRSASQRNLWGEAFERLTAEEKQILTKERHKEPLLILEDVIHLVERRSVDYQNSGWKLRTRGPKSDFNIRDGAVKVLKSVMTVKDLIASGVAHDPTGYASSAWSVVSLGLQLVQNDLDRLEAVFGSAVFLSDLLARFASIDRTFRDRILDDTLDFENTIVNVYSAILVYSAEITKQSQRKIPKRILQSLKALSGQPLKELKKKVEISEGENRKWRDLIEHQYRKQESAEVDEAVATVMARLDQANQAIARMEARTLTDEEHKILRWLSESDCSKLYRQAQVRREPESGAWFLDSPQFKNWKASLHSLLWLYGPSGCGKTVLSSIIVESLADWCETNSHTFLAYWFITFNDHQTLRIENLVASLIRQLCAAAKVLPRHLRDLWLKHDAAGSQPSTRILIETLDSVVSEFDNVGRYAFVVIDALDEVPNAKFQKHDSASTQDGQQTERRDLLDLIIGLDKRHSNLHFLVTSREEDDIRESFKESEALKVEDSVAGDLELYVNNALNRMIEREQWKGKWKAQMKSRIVGQNEKRFRWAYLQVQEFSDCVDPDQIKSALRTVPESLEATYTKALSRIPKRNAEKARFILLLIAHSFEPLSLIAVADAVALPEPDDVLNICTSTLVSDYWDFGSLPLFDSLYSIPATLRNHHRIVRLDHFSVKEYLISNSIQETTASYFYKSEELAHLILGEALVSFLIRTWEQKSKLTTPFCAYSIIHWLRHARKGQTCELPSSATGNAHSISKTSEFYAERELLENRTHDMFRVQFSAAHAAWFASWREADSDFFIINRAIASNLARNTPTLPLSCASLLGLRSHVEKLLDDGADIDARSSPLENGQEFTALQFAAFVGHLDVLSKLLSKGATVTQNDLEYIAAEGTTSLHNVLQLLLEEKHCLVTDQPLIISLLSNSAGTPDALAFLLSTSDTIAIDDTTIIECIEHRDTTDLLGLLLNYCRNSIKIDESIETWGSKASPDQIKLLFNCPKIVIGVEERRALYLMSLERAAFLGSRDFDYFDILQDLGLDIGAKELRRMVELVVKLQKSNWGVSEALLKHVGYHVIDERILLAGARNWNEADFGLMSFLLEHLERDLVITELFIVDVATCCGSGAPLLMEYVLQHKSDEVAVTDSAVVAAIEAYPHRILEKMMRLLLSARRQEPELSLAVIKAIFERLTGGGRTVLKILLEHMGPNILVGEEIMELARAADDRNRKSVFYKFFRDSERETYTEVLQNYKNKQIPDLGDHDE